MKKSVNSNDDLPVEKSKDRDVKGFIIRYELLAIIFALVIQTITAVQWGATVTTKLEYTQVSIQELKEELKQSMNERYTNADAAKDFSTINRRLDSADLRITVLENYKKK